MVTLPRKKRKQREKEKWQPDQKDKNFSKLMERFTYNIHSRAILFALVNTPVIEGLRYNKLHRTANQVFKEINTRTQLFINKLTQKPKEKMSAKTFDVHLKELVKTKLVERHEVSKYEVRYRVQFLDELTRSLARETARDIKLFQQAAEQTWSLLKKTGLSDEETAKHYISYFIDFLDLITLKTLYLGIKLTRDPVHLVFLLQSTYSQIINHIGLAIAYLSTVPEVSEEYLHNFLKGIQEKYDSMLKEMEQMKQEV